MNYLSIALTFISIWFCTLAYAQIANVEKIKFGKLSQGEMSLTTYTPMPDANAVVLIDKGDLSMNYSQHLGNFQYFLQRHLRIKVLTEAGTDQANFKFTLLDDGAGGEKITSIKGITYNKQMNGKWETVKLNKANIFEERIDENFVMISIVFPQVKAGSIIELRYDLSSTNLYNLPTWYFQTDIPVDYSEYRMETPEYFQYNLDMKGYHSDHLIQNDLNKYGSGSIIMVTKRGPQNLDYLTITNHWVAVQVPPFIEEPFSPAKRNFLFRVEFELGGIQFPFETIDFNYDWDDVARVYRKGSSYSTYMRKSRQLNEIVNTITTGVDTLTNIRNIYDGVHDYINWNGQFSSFCSGTPKDILTKGSGVSADLNFLLINLLRAKGYMVEPVLVKTRQEGFVSLARPSLSQFNHVIAAVSLPGRSTFLLDATQKDCPLGILPKFDLNERGRVIHENSSEWISLAPKAKAKMAIQINAKMEEERLSGSSTIKAEGYSAIDLKRIAYAADSPATFLSDLTGKTINNCELNGLGSRQEALVATFDLDFSDQLMDGGDLVYLQPVFFRQDEQNPFSAKERQFPIDFVTPQERIYVLSVELPESITVEDLPENKAFALPEGKGRYSMTYVLMGNVLRIIEKYQLTTSFFFAQEYDALKEFITLAAQQGETPVVLRKR